MSLPISARYFNVLVRQYLAFKVLEFYTYPHWIYIDHKITVSYSLIIHPVGRTSSILRLHVIPYPLADVEKLRLLTSHNSSLCREFSLIILSILY